MLGRSSLVNSQSRFESPRPVPARCLVPTAWKAVAQAQSASLRGTRGCCCTLRSISSSKPAPPSSRNKFYIRTVLFEALNRAERCNLLPLVSLIDPQMAHPEETMVKPSIQDVREQIACRINAASACALTAGHYLWVNGRASRCLLLPLCSLGVNTN